MKQFTILLFTSFIAIAIHAQSGTIDKSYGNDNTGTISGTGSFGPLTSAVQPDDKLLLAGASASNNYAIVRRNIDGLLDSSFNKGNPVTITIDDLVKNILQTTGWSCISAKKDGKIVAAGNLSTYGNINSMGDIVIGQFLVDGTPDESFGLHGRVITDLGFNETARAIAIQQDGQIVVAGVQTADLDNNNSGILLLRYNSDGTLDKTFGKGKGYAKYANGTDGYALIIQTDGKLVCGGSISGSKGGFYLIRILADGTLDPAFGEGGSIKTIFTNSDNTNFITSLALDEKGNIAATGSTRFHSYVGVSRYLPNGAPDLSFGEGGKLTFNNNSSYIDSKAIFAQQDGKLIICSGLLDTRSNQLRSALNSFSEDGMVESAFGTDNGITIGETKYTDIETENASMQKDGKILIVGNVYNSESGTYPITRYYGYPQRVPLAIRVKRFLHNHGISWKGLPADDKIAYYAVEQSSSNKTGFAPVAKVSGAANQKNYSITNSHLLEGINFYRIKAVSTDGTIRYSETVSADNTANTASVFPNPAKNYVTVQGLKTSETANISISDGSGNVKAKGVSTGSTQYRSSLNNLQPGTYYVNITTKEKTETLKFVKE